MTGVYKYLRLLKAKAKQSRKLGSMVAKGEKIREKKPKVFTPTYLCNNVSQVN